MATIPLSENATGRNIIIILGVFLVLDYLFVIVRYWSRTLKKQELQLNDWTMIAALGFVTALFFVEVAAVRNGGVGLHVVDLVLKWGGMNTIFTAGKLVLTADILWNMSTLTIKMSILHLYITIFGRTTPRFRLMVWIVMGICVTSTVIFIIQILVLCRPLAYFWDKSLDGKCGSLNLTYLIPGIIITAEDIAVFSLPMPLLWKLKMGTNKKIGATIIFGLGLAICLMSGVRLKYVIELDTNDFTASIPMFAILGTLEPMLGIISACLPMIPGLVSHYSKNRFMAWTQKGSSSNGMKKSVSSATGNITSHIDHANFERLSDHDYPLIDQTKSATRSNYHMVGGNWSSQTSTMGSAITVTRQYDVDSHLQTTDPRPQTTRRGPEVV